MNGTLIVVLPNAKFRLNPKSASFARSQLTKAASSTRLTGRAAKISVAMSDGSNVTVDPESKIAVTLPGVRMLSLAELLKDISEIVAT